MSDRIGERFIEGRIINLDKEPIENLEKLLKNVSKKENDLRNNLDNMMGKLISM